MSKFNSNKGAAKTGSKTATAPVKPKHPSDGLVEVPRYVNMKNKAITLQEFEEKELYNKQVFSSNTDKKLRYIADLGRDGKLYLYNNFKHVRKTARSHMKETIEGNNISFYTWFDQSREDVNFRSGKRHEYLLDYVLAPENQHLFLSPQTIETIDGLDRKKVASIVFDESKFKWKEAPADDLDSEGNALPPRTSVGTNTTKLSNGVVFPDIDIWEINKETGKVECTYSVPRKWDNMTEQQAAEFKQKEAEFIAKYPTALVAIEKHMKWWNCKCTWITQELGLFAGEKNSAKLQYSEKLKTVFILERHDVQHTEHIGPAGMDLSDFMSPSEIEATKTTSSTKSTTAAATISVPDPLEAVQSEGDDETIEGDDEPIEEGGEEGAEEDDVEMIE